jgi:hypothetical protein
VCRETIGLYSDAETRPREVEPVAEAVGLDGILAHRPRKTAAHEQPPHLDLKPGLERGVLAATIEDAPQCRSTRAAASTELGEAPPQARFADEPSVECVFDGSFQRLVVEHAGQIDECARRCRDRDAVASCSVGARELVGPMHRQLRRAQPARVRHPHLHSRRGHAVEIPQDASSPMRHNGARPCPQARSDGRLTTRCRRATEPVHTGQNGLPVAGRQSSLHLALRPAERARLNARQRSVLSIRQFIGP